MRKKRCLTAPPDMRALLCTLREIAAGMAFLHSKDVLHCDLTGGCWGRLGRLLGAEVRVGSGGLQLGTVAGLMVCLEVACLPRVRVFYCAPTLHVCSG